MLVKTIVHLTSELGMNGFVWMALCAIFGATWKSLPNEKFMVFGAGGKEAGMFEVIIFFSSIEEDKLNGGGVEWAVELFDKLVEVENGSFTREWLEIPTEFSG